MALHIPHLPVVKRHSTIPYLWRIVCPACGWTALSGTEANARLAAQHHHEEEEPFPFDMISDDPTHGRQED